MQLTYSNICFSPQSESNTAYYVCGHLYLSLHHETVSIHSCSELLAALLALLARIKLASNAAN